MSGASLGKGAWDCDANAPIPPEKEAEVFEEIATMNFPFEGIPTVPPGKDTKRMAFYCGRSRNIVTAAPTDSVARVKQALVAGGISNADRPAHVRHTPGIRTWEDLELIYAGQLMENDKTLADYHVPQGCKAMIAIEGAKLRSGKLDRDHPYWN